MKKKAMKGELDLVKKNYEFFGKNLDNSYFLYLYG